MIKLIRKHLSFDTRQPDVLFEGENTTSNLRKAMRMGVANERAQRRHLTAAYDHDPVKLDYYLRELEGCHVVMIDEKPLEWTDYHRGMSEIFEKMGVEFIYDEGDKTKKSR